MKQDNIPPRRGNRSFVIREGRFTDGQKKAFEQLWPQFGIDIASVDIFKPDEYFPTSQPLILDIGFGSGDSLMSLAQQRPDLNFLGVEVYRPGIGAVMRKIKQHEITNIRVMNTDAVQLLKCKLADNFLTGVMVWFPDPWPKKRHHKRRLVQEAFLLELVRVMQRDAILHLASDWQPYVDFMREHVAKVKQLIAIEKQQNPLNLQRPATRFEQRGLRKGHQVSDLIYRVNK